jgi:hypothetical protein
MLTRPQTFGKTRVSEMRDVPASCRWAAARPVVIG